MTVSLSDSIETQKLFPLYVFLARLVSPEPTAEVGVSTSDIYNWIDLLPNVICHFIA